jgi:hypothetical protein
MSRARRPKRLVYSDQNGKEYVSHWRETSLRTPASIPRRDHIVDMYDPSGHLVAVLAEAQVGAPPLVYQHSSTLAPYLALSDGQLYALLVSNTDEGWRVSAFGSPRDMWPVECPDCRESFELHREPLVAASALRTKRGAACIQLASVSRR